MLLGEHQLTVTDFANTAMSVFSLANAELHPVKLFYQHY